MDAAEAWRQIRARLHEDLPRATYETWVESAQAEDGPGGALTLVVANSVARGELQKLEALRRRTDEVLGPWVQIRVVVAGTRDGSSEK